MFSSLTLEQLRVFLAVVEKGSFSGAARRLRRAQSAVSYAIGQLEKGLGFSLFERQGHKPSLTVEGKAFFIEAQGILEHLEEVEERLQGIRGGMEPSLSLVIDALYPMDSLIQLCKRFYDAFPHVSLRLSMEALGGPWSSVSEGRANLGLALADRIQVAGIRVRQVAEIVLLPVIAAEHPLAQQTGAIPERLLRREVQIVLSDRSPLTEGVDRGVLSERTWRVAELSTKHALLKAGLGWGNMPLHMILEDLRSGKLRILQLEASNILDWRVPVCVISRREASHGPAGRWLLAELAAISRETLPTVHREELLRDLGSLIPATCLQGDDALAERVKRPSVVRKREEREDNR
jgi:DNA-binding transcriptional LysR family regulator